MKAKLVATHRPETPILPYRGKSLDFLFPSLCTSFLGQLDSFLLCRVSHTMLGGTVDGVIAETASKANLAPDLAISWPVQPVQHHRPAASVAACSLRLSSNLAGNGPKKESPP